MYPIYVANHDFTYFTDRYEKSKLNEARFILQQQYDEHRALMRAEEDARKKGLEEERKRIALERKKFEEAHGYLSPERLQQVLECAPEEIKKYLRRIELFKESNDEQKAFECLQFIILLEGIPGVGKSDLAKAIGQKTGRPVYVVETAHLATSFKDSAAENLRKSIENAVKKDKKIVIILEELQSIIDTRKEAIRSEQILPHLYGE